MRNQFLSDKNSMKMVVYYECAGRQFDGVIFQPDAGLRATNWFKLWHMPQSVFKVCRHKSS